MLTAGALVMQQFLLYRDGESISWADPPSDLMEELTVLVYEAMAPLDRARRKTRK